MEFENLSLPAPLRQALNDLSFKEATPIQARSIPVLLEGRDLIGQAATGTGKTAAFGLPLLAQLLADPTAIGLVLAPTRELAAQVLEVLGSLSKFIPGLRPSLLIGGTSMLPQLRTLSRKPRLIVATPGRLIDHLERKSVDLKTLKFLVLDEADRMLDMGFAPQLREILRYLPKERQTALFSATLPPNILELSRQFLRDPARVTVEGPKADKPKIHHETLRTTTHSKTSALLEVLKVRKGSIVIFARTQSRTDRLGRALQQAGYRIEILHGGRNQAQRKRALEAFRAERSPILVATDIAARGLDIDHVAHVINYDLPMVPEDFVHRIGRTGRAGREGQALSFLTPEEAGLWRDIERHLAQGEGGASAGGSGGGGSRPPSGPRQGRGRAGVGPRPKPASRWQKRGSGRAEGQGEGAPTRFLGHPPKRKGAPGKGRGGGGGRGPGGPRRGS